MTQTGGIAVKPYYRPGNYTMANSVGYLMRVCINQLLPRMEALFAHEALSFSQWTTLVALHDGRIRTAGDLARNICHDAGSLTRLIDQLIDRGLVARSRSQTDRRVVTLTLTPPGSALVEGLAPRMMTLWNELLSGFSHGEIDTLIALLTRLVIATENTGQDGGPSRLVISRAPIARPVARSASRRKAGKPRKP